MVAQNRAASRLDKSVPPCNSKRQLIWFPLRQFVVRDVRIIVYIDNFDNGFVRFDSSPL